MLDYLFHMEDSWEHKKQSITLFLYWVFHSDEISESKFFKKIFKNFKFL